MYIDSQSLLVAHTLLIHSISKLSQYLPCSLIDMIIPKLRPLDLARYLGILTLGDHAKEVALLLRHQNLADDVGIEELTESLQDGSKVSKHDAILLKLQEMVQAYFEENPNPISLLKKGCKVSTRNARIAPKTEKVVKVRHAREVTYGNVLKQSEYFPYLFLVYFYQIERYFYVTDKVVKFEGDCKVTHTFSNTSNPGTLVEIQNKSDDSFLILFHILNGKIHNNVGPPGTNLTIPEIVKLFQPFFTWMTADKLYKFVNKHRTKSHTKSTEMKSIGTNSKDTSTTPSKSNNHTTDVSSLPRKVSPGRYHIHCINIH